MKKGLIITLAFVSLFAVGCGKSKKEREKEYQQVMEEYARNYFETYILNVVEGLDVPEITIQNLKDANEYGSNYDLSKLKDCTDESKARIILDETKRGIASVEFEMNCK